MIAIRNRLDRPGYTPTFADIEASLENARNVAKLSAVETDADRDLEMWRSLVDLAALVTRLAAHPHAAIWQMTALRVTASGFGKVKIAQLNPATGEWFDTTLDDLHGMFGDEEAAHAAIESYRQKHNVGDYHKGEPSPKERFRPVIFPGKTTLIQQHVNGVWRVIHVNGVIAFADNTAAETAIRDYALRHFRAYSVDMPVVVKTKETPDEWLAKNQPSSTRASVVTLRTVINGVTNRWVIERWRPGEDVWVPFPEIADSFDDETQATNAMMNLDEPALIEHTPTHFKIVKIDGAFYFRKWSHYNSEHPKAWYLSGTAAGWKQHQPLNVHFNSFQDAVEAFGEWTQGNTTENVLVMDTPAVLAGETPTIRMDIMNGAFRLVTDPGSAKVCVERFDALQGEWTCLLRGCEPNLWPWRQWDSEAEAEKAILAYGIASNQPVTIVRHGGTEISQAHPGNPFPTQEETLAMVNAWSAPDPTKNLLDLVDAERNHRESLQACKAITNATETHLWRVCPCPSCVAYRAELDREKFPASSPSIEHVSISEDTNIPEHDGTFRIIPTLDTVAGQTWFIQRWSASVTMWRPMRGPNFPPAISYWAAVDQLAAASERFGEVIRLATPTTAQIERWKVKGIVLSDPGADPVTMTASVEDAAGTIAALVQETSALIGATTAPVVPAIGTKRPIHTGDGLYGIEEWTAEGWSMTVDDLAWEDVEGHIRPDVSTEEIEMIAAGAVSGECRMSPSTELTDGFDVIQWTGKAWKKIAGNVTKRTAEGVIQARKMDPEAIASSGSSTTKQWRKMMKGARADLRAIIRLIDDHPSSASTLLSDIREICDDRIKQMSEG